VRSLVVVIALGSGAVQAQTMQPNFAHQVVIPGWDAAIGVMFSADGRGYVWEKGGKVWLIENGQKSAQPLIDISEEAANWGDYGLLGFALDPDFNNNGYIYLSYVVDYYYLTHFGLPGYDPTVSEDFHDTIGRITRYTARASDGHHTVDPASRLILLGESITTGVPICNTSHGMGAMMFAPDGTLLASCGEAADFIEVDNGGSRPGSSNTALADGIITPAQDVGAYRSQMVDCLSGKVLRLNPANGNGIPSNPFYDAAHPRSARSRVWEMGLRNPYRWILRPGTGSTDPNAAHPGTLYITDVGWADREELNMAPSGGLNFGWPIFEGLEPQPLYAQTPVPYNQSEINPLNGVGGCSDPFFRFTDLLVQATQDAPSWPNPCNPSLQVPPTAHRFVHQRPVYDYGHDHNVRVGIYTNGQADTVPLGDPSSPIQGPQFNGTCAVGTTWYLGSQFPADYYDSLFIADYTGGWIRNVQIDSAGNPIDVRPFADGLGGVTTVTANPVDGQIYYVAFDEVGNSALHTIYWTNNLPPVAVADATPRYGPTPLSVQFTGDGSSDPEGGPITYLWDFGDGSVSSTDANPVHVYRPTEDITAQGTVVARVFSFDPPFPTGHGNPDPNVMRDGVYPPLGTIDQMLQWDTFHDADQYGDDWVGYTFDTPHEIRWLDFQEGVHTPDGGWWNALLVEFLVNGEWVAANNTAIWPPYGAAQALSYTRYTIGFDPVVATGVRLHGVPGGVTPYVSFGEFRVIASPANPTHTPTAYTARLTVTDPLGASSSTSLLISPDNSPPQVTITSPVDGSHYEVGGSVTEQLRAQVSDAETPTANLSYAWQSILHHNTHIHPGPIVNQPSPDIVIETPGCTSEIFFWEFKLTVTDPQGLQTTRSSFVYPHCTCYANCDGSTTPPVLNINDFICFQTAFAAGEHYANCDGSTVDPVLTVNDFICFQSAFAAGCP
jgi:glucose/arabinose dehydrogenase